MQVFGNTLGIDNTNWQNSYFSNILSTLSYIIWDSPVFKNLAKYDTNAAPQIKSGDSITARSNFPIRHTSPVDEGSIYAFGDFPHNDLISFPGLRWQQNTVTTMTTAMYNTNYSGIGAWFTGMNVTLSFYLKPENVSIADEQWIFSAYDGTGTTSPSASDIAIKLFMQSNDITFCLLYTSPSPRDGLLSRMPSSA